MKRQMCVSQPTTNCLTLQWQQYFCVIFFYFFISTSLSFNLSLEPESWSWTTKSWSWSWSWSCWSESWLHHWWRYRNFIIIIIIIKRGEKISNATWFGKWWWLCCTQMGSKGQRRMETQRKDVENLLYGRRLKVAGHEIWGSPSGSVLCDYFPNQNVHLHTNFHHNWTIHGLDTKISPFFTCATQ